MSGASGFTFATDVYAFGVVMYEMLTFQVPWSSETIDTKPPANTTAISSISAAAAAKNKNKNKNKNNSTSGKNNSHGSWQIISWLLEGQRPRVPDELAGGRFEGIDRYTSLMERCWAQDAESRPSFAELVPELRSIAMAVMAAQKKTAM
jgi:serine/threonine protein kinase